MIKTQRKTYMFSATKQQVPTVYALTKIIRCKIFNHKTFIKTLETKNILDNLNNLPCSCTTSPFTDPNHGHIVTEDIHIVQNNKLRKLLCKVIKYRETVSVNFSDCNTEIKNSLIQWISLVMGKINKRIKELKLKN